MSSADILKRLGQASSMHFEDFSPAPVIQAVNTLHSLGKGLALEWIGKYLAARDKREDAYGMFWVLRVLFEVPEKPGFPPVRLGRPSIPPPDRPGRLPRFPIVMVEDIPLLPIRGYDLMGLPEPVENHVAYFRTHGTLRKNPLSRPASLEVVEGQFLRLWQAAYEGAYVNEALETVRVQIRRLAKANRDIWADDNPPDD